MYEWMQEAIEIWIKRNNWTMSILNGREEREEEDNTVPN